MSKILLWSRGHTSPSHEASTMWAMRWFLLYVVLIWILAAMVLPVVVFCLTRNPYSFSFFTTLAPPVGFLYWIVRYVFPMDEKTFELKKLQIQMKAQNNNKSN
jgi:hypothetical protein